MIYIVPECGLCNRIRVIDSGISLANEWNVKLVIFWKLNNDLNASFYDLFEPLYTNCGKVEIIEINNADYNFDVYKIYFKGLKYFSNPILINIDNFPNNPLSFIYNSLYSSFLIGKDDYSCQIKNICEYWSIYFKKNIFIKTYSRFHQSIFSDYKNFLPNKDIVTLSNVLLTQFADQMVGVHIRRTDNKDSVLRSSNQLFENEMVDMLKLNPNLKFYLSTDSENDKLYFTNLFAGKVISNNCEFDRNSKLSIKHALIDLICLSKCNFILGSYYSSFSEFAITYNGLKDYKIVF
jgi:hypothetical protein